MIWWAIGTAVALLSILCGARCSYATDRYDMHLQKYARIYFSHAVDWLWFKAQTRAESAFDPNARSCVGAVGLMQLMPFTSKEVARQLGISNIPQNPELNIHMGIYYDRRCWSIFKAERGIERLRFMFGAYNAGPGRIIHAQGQAVQCQLRTDTWEGIRGFVPGETYQYVDRIDLFYLEYRARIFVIDIRVEP